MELDLKGKAVLITGGSKGIGFACATAFAAEGARIAICSRSQENISRSVAALPGAFGIPADLTDAAAAAQMIDTVETRLGPVDILVCSAGAARRTPPDQLTPGLWRAAMDAKFFTYVNVIDPLVKRMARRGRGVIINVIGVGGKAPSPAHIAGGSANAALMLATAGSALPMQPKGSRRWGKSRPDGYKPGCGRHGGLGAIRRH